LNCNSASSLHGQRSAMIISVSNYFFFSQDLVSNSRLGQPPAPFSIPMAWMHSWCVAGSIIHWPLIRNSYSILARSLSWTIRSWSFMKSTSVRLCKLIQNVRSDIHFEYAMGMRSIASQFVSKSINPKYFFEETWYILFILSWKNHATIWFLRTASTRTRNPAEPIRGHPKQH
jgi:hypothetical protein